MKCWLSTHVLDIHSGLPANGVRIELGFTPNLKEAQQLNFDSYWSYYGNTDNNGRISGTSESPWKPRPENAKENRIRWKMSNVAMKGYYQLKFYILEYFKKENQDSFYPIATIQFQVTRNDVESNRHFHVPCLISNYGFTTYRGSSNTPGAVKSKL